MIKRNASNVTLWFFHLSLLPLLSPASIPGGARREKGEKISSSSNLLNFIPASHWWRCFDKNEMKGDPRAGTRCPGKKKSLNRMNIEFHLRSTTRWKRSGGIFHRIFFQTGSLSFPTRARARARVRVKYLYQPIGRANKVSKVTHNQVLIFPKACPGEHTRTLDTGQDNKGVQK